MFRRSILIACLTLFAAVSTPVSTASASDDPTTLFINLYSDDVWTQQMALGFAKRVQGMGHPVVVFLNVRAVTLANSAAPAHTHAMSGRTGQEMIQELIAGGARVFLCPSCTRQAGLSLENRIEGVEPGSPETIAIMMDPNTKVMSW